jgi:large subunit ribosomal protein L4
MPEIAVQNWKKKKLRTLELNEAVFDYPLKQHLIYEAVLAYQAAGRSGTHKTKNRIEVSGGTRKLWRQKGTGRARMGDNRSPLWRHGGTIHGPQPRDYSWRLPKKMRRNALRSILAQKLRDGELICLESLELKSHKTKALEDAISDGLGLESQTLLVPIDDEDNLTLAARNNPRLKVIRALGLNVVDLLQSDHVVFSETALKRLNEVLAS